MRALDTVAAVLAVLVILVAIVAFVLVLPQLLPLLDVWARPGNQQSSVGGGSIGHG